MTSLATQPLHAENSVLLRGRTAAEDTRLCVCTHRGAYTPTGGVSQVEARPAAKQMTDALS